MTIVFSASGFDGGNIENRWKMILTQWDLPDLTKEEIVKCMKYVTENESSKDLRQLVMHAAVFMALEILLAWDK